MAELKAASPCPEVSHIDGATQRSSTGSVSRDLPRVSLDRKQPLAAGLRSSGPRQSPLSDMVDRGHHGPPSCATRTPSEVRGPSPLVDLNRANLSDYICDYSGSSYIPSLDDSYRKLMTKTRQRRDNVYLLSAL